MTRDDSRAQRFARTWWGPCLAALVGIGSASEPAAMPLPGEKAQLPGPILTQQSSKPDAQQPAGAPAAPSSDSFIELHQAIWDVLREEVLAGYRQQLAA